MTYFGGVFFGEHLLKVSCCSCIFLLGGIQVIPFSKIPQVL